MFALISLALAADTVVYSGGDMASAVARVAKLTGGAAQELHAVSVAELMSGRPPTMVSGGQLSLCSGAPSSPDGVRQSLKLAEGAVKYMEFGSARAALDATIRDLNCLQIAVDPAQASRAWYLLGIVDAASNDQAASREDFRRARLFSPSMVWDDNFAPNARATFDAIAAEAKAPALVPLTVLPAPAEGAFRLDGRPMQLIDGHVGVSAGDHYVQIGDSKGEPTGAGATQGSMVTVSLHVDGNTPPMLVLPSLVGPDVLNWAGDGDKRGALSAVLVSALGSEGIVYVVNPSVVWRVRLGGSAWDLVADPGNSTATTRPAVKPLAQQKPAPLPMDPVATPAKKKPGVVGPVLMGVGGATGVAGGVVALLGYTRAVAAYNDAVDNGTSQADRTKYVSGGRQLRTGAVIGGVGAVILATGVVVTIAF